VVVLIASSSAPAWTVIATVAASIAALAALITVGQAVSYRNETRRQTLADAIITAVSATELDLTPDEEGYADWQRRVADAGRQVDRAIVHSLLGFVSRNDVTETMTKMMEPSPKAEPHVMFMLGTKALQEMIDREKARHAPWPWRLLYPEPDAPPPP
jgi:hypothetical protein